jgi:L-aspartate oxidase
VLLDARDALGERFATRFPTVAAACLAAGIDPARQAIPVAPAAHYHMGGIAVDADGRTSVPGLWAVGEVAATGLHGANRLASNSLLEAAVFGLRAARAVSGIEAALRRLKVPHRTAPHEPTVADWRELQRVRAVMDASVGVERDNESLRSAIVELNALRVGSLGRARAVQAAATAGLLIATAALGRTESRGGHFRRDFPGHDPAQARRSVYTADALLAEAAAVCAAEPARVAAAVAG